MINKSSTPSSKAITQTLNSAAASKNKLTVNTGQAPIQGSFQGAYSPISMIQKKSRNQVMDHQKAYTLDLENDEVKSFENNDNSDSSYKDHAKLVYQIGKKEGWNTQQIFNMLSDKKKFQAYLDRQKPTAKKSMYSTQAPVVNRLLQDNQSRALKKQQFEAEQLKLKQQEAQKITSSRTFNKGDNDQFLLNQNYYEQRKYHKILKLQQEEEQKVRKIQTLELSNKTIKLANSKRKQSPHQTVYDRLHQELNELKEKRESEVQNYLTQDISKKDKKTDASIQEVTQRVYNDAVMKRQSNKSTLEQSYLSRESILKADYTLSKSIKIIERKIKVDLNRALEERGLRIDSLVTIEQMRELLFDLGFTSQNKQSSYEAKLMNELGTMLIPPTLNPTSEDDSKILIENFRDILWAILSINKNENQNQSVQENSIEQTGTTLQNRLSKLRNLEFSQLGKLKLTNKDSLWLCSHFAIFAQNRSSFANQNQQKLSQFRATSASNEKAYNYKPQLSSSTQKIANKKLEQNLKEYDGSYFDYLVEQGKKIQEKKEVMQKLKIDNETKSLLFTPQINRNYKSSLQQHKGNQSQRTKYSNLNKCEQLYLMAMEKPQYSTRNYDEMILERDFEQYTFQPNVALNIGGSPGRSKVLNSSLKGRSPLKLSTKVPQKRDPKLKIQSKFIHSKHALEQEMPQEENEKAALLYIDVNIGQGKRPPRIILREGDKVEDVASHFTQSHNLDDTMRKKLILLLYHQLDKINGTNSTRQVVEIEE